MKNDIRKNLRPHYLTEPCFDKLCCEDCLEWDKCSMNATDDEDE